MRLNDEQRSQINELMGQAHHRATRPDGSLSSRAVPVHFVDLLGEVEGADPHFVGDYLLALAMKGASKVAADWRRTQAPVVAKTAKGTPVEVPRLGGIRRRTPQGSTEYVQVALDGMTVNELRAQRTSLESGRNTTSRRIRLLSDLIDLMEAEGYTTASEALEHLRRAS